MASLLAAPYSYFTDNNGEPLSGGKIYTYTAGGTSTPKDTYTDASGSTPASNPVILDSEGRAAIWLDGTYYISVKTSADVLIRNTDNVAATGGSATTSFTDSTFFITDDGDATKKIAFQASSISPGTTRTVTVPDKNGTMAMTSDITTNVIYSHISGFLPTAQTFTSSTISSLTITAGQATDSTNASMLAGTSFSWNITNGNAGNGYQGGTTLPNSSTIHFYVIATASDTSWTSSFASLSLTPTLPGSFTKYRRIFSLKTNGSGVPIAYTAVEYLGGSTLNWLATQTQDVSVVNLSTSRTLYTLNVPGGVKVQPLIRASSTSGAYVILTSPDETDVAPATSYTAAPQFDLQNTVSVANTLVPKTILTTNTSAQIGARASAGSTSLDITTAGWIDFRI